MRNLYIVTVALVLALFAVATPGLGGGVVYANACPPNPSPPDAGDPSMILEAPAEGARVTSPVTISGQARVFEANVRITIYDRDGDELVDTFTTAEEAGPTLAPFSESVAFSVTSEQAGCIRVWEESAEDGSARNVVQHEVTLAPATTPTTPPSTGSGGLYGGGVVSTHMWLYAAGAMAMASAMLLAFKRSLWD